MKKTTLRAPSVRDEPLIRILADYLGCGRISKNREGIYFVGRRPVTKFKDLTVKVIPRARQAHVSYPNLWRGSRPEVETLLKNHPILGKKSLDF